MLSADAEPVEPVDDARQPDRAADRKRLPRQQVETRPGKERRAPRISPDFGPDRRRNTNAAYSGPERRVGGEVEVLQQPSLLDKARSTV